MKVLIDALYINNGGGKVLLDYLIKKLENTEIDFTYLLDNRIKNNHTTIENSAVIYMKASLISRTVFYLNNKNNFQKILCFGNLPPNLKCGALVYTYFHQPLFLKLPDNISFTKKVIFNIKIGILNILKRNTDCWLVQNQYISESLSDKYDISKDKIKVLPFYPELKSTGNIYTREPLSFIYVSASGPHKNHKLLIESFCDFFDKSKKGHLTITVSNDEDITALVEQKASKGYPITNLGFIKRDDLFAHYNSNEFLIFPSLAESFGLGLVEGIENGCKVIASDLPYTYQVCNPSLVFNPLIKESLVQAFEKASTNNTNFPEQLIHNQIDDLISLLKN